jgi:hypothetical protein
MKAIVRDTYGSPELLELSTRSKRQWSTVWSV